MASSKVPPHCSVRRAISNLEEIDQNVTRSFAAILIWIQSDPCRFNWEVKYLKGFLDIKFKELSIELSKQACEKYASEHEET